MKKYIKYKDFLPPHYVDKSINKNKKSNRKAIWMLVILNFYMLPINLQNFIKGNNSQITFNDMYYDNNGKIIEEISEWLKVASLDIDSIEVKDNKGIINVINKDVLCEVENNGYGIVQITQENSIYKADLIKDE